MSNSTNLLKKIDLGKYSTFIGLVILCIALTVLSPQFLTGNNLINVASQVTVNAIISIGMTVVILTGGIDLSVGSVLAVCGIIMGMVMKAGVSVPVAMMICIMVGVAAGLLNGIMVTYGKLPAFIATLGMMSIARAIALILSKGAVLSSFPASFRVIGVDTIPGIGLPLQVLLMVVLYFLAYYFLKYRKSGRYIYAIGGNKEATRLSGVNVRKFETLTYVIAGVAAAVAAIVLTSKLNAAQPTAGYGYELDAVAAVVIGGTSLTGGNGSVWGTLIGAVIMGVLRNGLNLLNVSTYYQQLIIGLVIIFAVLIDTIRKKA